MAKFLIDANLPYYFETWKGEDYLHVFDLNDEMKDRDLWEYARTRNMVIVSKDADFSDRVMLSEPPPHVVQICIGNMKMRRFHAHIGRDWPWVLENVDNYRLIRLFTDRIEAVE